MRLNWEAEERLQALYRLRDLQTELAERKAAAQDAYRPPLPHQIPPQGAWDGWLLLAGRGAGKTEAAARWITAHIRGPACFTQGAPHRIAIIAPTLGDAVHACVRGPSGLKTFEPAATMRTEPGGTIVRWPNGAEAKLFGTSTEADVDHLRAGGNTCAAWAEELAAWRYLDDGWDHLQFGLRMGPHPRWVASTTPKPRLRIRKLVEDATVAVTRAHMLDNPHLADVTRRKLEERYAGTQIGRQELGGELIEEDEGALWRRAWLDAGRLRAAPDLVRVCVGVDPSGGAGEQGIVVVGRGYDGHGYVLADRSCRLSPDGWGHRTVQAWLDFEADTVAAEVNFGGDMVASVVRGVASRMAEQGHPTGSLPIKLPRASRGKRVRAEPVAALAEAQPIRWHHVGSFPDLEDQLCTWTPESGYSPDRLDACVWSAWQLGLVSTVPTGQMDWSAAGRMASEVITR